jgi:multiple antibiotic resistance protein
MLAAAAYLKIFLAFLVIVDPLGVIPVYAALTANDSSVVRARVARTASFTVAGVLAGSVIAGEAILNWFGITIASFKVGGAILILLMAIGMLRSDPLREKQTPEEAVEAEHKTSIAVVPIGVPLLVGPGAMSTAIIYAVDGQGLVHRLILVALSVGVGLITWLCLKAADPLSRLMGRTGMNIMIRLMGVILAAVAVEIFCAGIVILLPGLAGHPSGAAQ